MTAKFISGISGLGNVCGILPKREPIVSTSMPNIETITVASIITNNEPGIFCIKLLGYKLDICCQIIIISTEPTPIQAELNFIEWKLAA
ncbi:hypothetical protein SDC9_173826 [bioreactor metagenome]|uniref:Uncharacterized protein n=1 Tax=bioreactor metagenome TaxID=1076179 RepID=A0A645GKK8_9ZZZZ